MAETYDLTVGSTTFSAVSAMSKLFVVEGECDTSSQNLASGDTAKVLSIPADTFVWRVLAEVETAEGGAATVDIGDGDDPDGFHDGLNVNSEAKTMSTLSLTEADPNTVTGYSNGNFYSVADTIDILANAALDKAVIKLKAICIKMD